MTRLPTDIGERLLPSCTRPLGLRRYRLPALALGLCCLAAVAAPGGVVAAEEPWEVVADRITRFKDPAVIVAEGNVVLQRKKTGAVRQLVVKADWVRYDVTVGKVKARGNITMESATERVVAEAARLDLNDQTGTLENGTLILDHGDYAIRIAGLELNKTGDETYTVKESRVTTCPARPGKVLPWVMESRDVRVKKDGMAVVRSASLRIRETPVLYTPFMTFPAKTKRESGFLLPEYSSSQRDGFGLVVPYFVNINPSVDATFYPGYLAERGLLAGAEFRYVADARSRGTFAVNYLHDDKEDAVGDDFNDDNILRRDQNRYWLRGKLDHDFGNGMTGKLDLDLVSDQDFLQEFRKGMSGFDVNDRQAQNDFNRGYQEETVAQRQTTMQLAKSWSSMQVLGGMAFVQDVSEPASVTTPIHTMPRLQFNGRQPLGRHRASLAWSSEYLYYYRKQGLGYHRADLAPRLVWSVPGRYLEGYVSGTLRETLYLIDDNSSTAASAWAHSDSQARTAQEYEVNVSSPWVRSYGARGGDGGAFTHTMRPQLIYAYAPSADQVTLPNLDFVDRLAARNQITYAWNNHFHGGGPAAGTGRDHALGQFNLQQTYNIREANRDLSSAGDKNRPYSAILLETELSPWAGVNLSYDSAWSVYSQGNTYYQVLAGYGSADAENRLTASYTYQRNPSVREPFFYSGVTPNSERKLTGTFDARLTETISLRGSIDQRRQSGNNHVDESLQLIYQQPCWGATLLMSNTDEDQRVALMFSLTGIGDFAGFGFAGEGGVDYDLF